MYERTLMSLYARLLLTLAHFRVRNRVRSQKYVRGRRFAWRVAISGQTGSGNVKETKRMNAQSSIIRPEGTLKGKNGNGKKELKRATENCATGKSATDNCATKKLGNGRKCNRKIGQRKMRHRKKATSTQPRKNGSWEFGQRMGQR